MDTSLGLLLLLIGTLAIIHIVQGQSQQGFISLDCGLPANETYKEERTELQFSSDAPFIQSGETDKVQEIQENIFLRPYRSLRYFPEGIRNCYNIPVQKARKHMITARFVYGNYDGLDISPKFDLYLGPNLWVTVDLERLVNGTREQIIHIPTSNSLQICLVKTGKTIPMISALEIRPMKNNSYTITSGSLKLYLRQYFTKSTSYLRFPNDVYDRQWTAYAQTEWNLVSNTSLVNPISNIYEPPVAALNTAAIPSSASVPLTIKWSSENTDEYYFYPHFAEIQDLQANETREFNIKFSGYDYSGPIIPKKLVLTTIESSTSRTCNRGNCSLELVRTNRSTLPPLLNALEVYTVIQFPQSETILGLTFGF